MSKEPTREQSKEFWKRCGVEGRNSCWEGRWQFRAGYYCDCHYKNEFISEDIPPIDLNNLFKYAVPLLLNKLGKSGLVRILRDWIYDVIMYEKDPALALFWAIWEVFHNE